MSAQPNQLPSRGGGSLSGQRSLGSVLVAGAPPPSSAPTAPAGPPAPPSPAPPSPPVPKKEQSTPSGQGSSSHQSNELCGMPWHSPLTSGGRLSPGDGPLVMPPAASNPLTPPVEVAPPEPNFRMADGRGGSLQQALAKRSRPSSSDARRSRRPTSVPLRTSSLPPISATLSPFAALGHRNAPTGLRPPPPACGLPLAPPAPPAPRCLRLRRLSFPPAAPERRLESRDSRRSAGGPTPHERKNARNSSLALASCKIGAPQDYAIKDSMINGSWVGKRSIVVGRGRDGRGLGLLFAAASPSPSSYLTCSSSQVMCLSIEGRNLRFLLLAGPPRLPTAQASPRDSWRLRQHARHVRPV